MFKLKVGHRAASDRIYLFLCESGRLLNICESRLNRLATRIRLLIVAFSALLLILQTKHFIRPGECLQAYNSVVRVDRATQSDIATSENLPYPPKLRNLL